jgi:outer membrane biosynthesis protein TonB
MRRSLALVFAMSVVMLLAPARADAVTVHDLIELSHEGLSDPILIALIDVDHTVFTLDAATVKQLKQSGVSDAVILAMIRSGRTSPAPAAPPNADPTEVPEPVSQTQEPAPQPPPALGEVQPRAPEYVPVPVPVAVPVFVPTLRQRPEYVRTTVQADDGSDVNVKVPLAPNCTKGEPVYWGFGGKLRPNSWAPPTTIVCR